MAGQNAKSAPQCSKPSFQRFKARHFLRQHLDQRFWNQHIVLELLWYGIGLWLTLLTECEPRDALQGPRGAWEDSASPKPLDGERFKKMLDTSSSQSERDEKQEQGTCAVSEANVRNFQSDVKNWEPHVSLKGVRFIWVAVKELKLSYHNGYTYIYIYGDPPPRSSWSMFPT